MEPRHNVARLYAEMQDSWCLSAWSDAQYLALIAAESYLCSTEDLFEPLPSLCALHCGP
jgi:hypothetical protein